MTFFRNEQITVMKPKPLTFLLALTFLFLFAGISEAGLRLLIAKKITKTILKILVDDIKERPLLHLVEGGKFAAKKIKARADKGREMKEEDVSRDYISGDPLYLEPDDTNSDNYSSIY